MSGGVKMFTITFGPEAYGEFALEEDAKKVLREKGWRLGSYGVYRADVDVLGLSSLQMVFAVIRVRKSHYVVLDISGLPCNSGNSIEA